MEKQPAPAASQKVSTGLQANHYDDDNEGKDDDDDEEDFVRLYRKVNNNRGQLSQQQDQVNKSANQKQSTRDAQTSPIKALEVRARQ